MKVSAFLVPLALAASATASPAAAQDLEVTVTPYFWAAGLKGDLAPVPGLPTVHTETSFSEALDSLQMGLAAATEVRKGRWALLLDLGYVDSGSSAELADAGTEFVSAGVGAKSLSGTLAVAYRVAETPGGTTVDALAGARVNWAENDIRLTRADASEARGTDDETWTDPIVGLRVVSRFSPRWSATGYADVGGFGLSSDLTWQAMASVGYHFNERMALSVGYRYYAIDYDHDGFVLDVAQYGPVIGLATRF